MIFLSVSTVQQITGSKGKKNRQLIAYFIPDFRPDAVAEFKQHFKGDLLDGLV